MFKSSDPYTYTLSGPLVITAGGDTAGLFAAQYKIAHYDDVQMLSGSATKGVSTQGFRKYIVSVTQRVILYNPSGMVIEPLDSPTSYDDYPALLNMKMTVIDQKKTGIDIELIGYSPQTVNTQQQVSNATTSGGTDSSSTGTSNTIGSSLTETNSYGLTVGVFNPINASVHSDHSSSKTSQSSLTNSTQSGHTNTEEASSSNYMSIKDWGAYCLVNPLIVSLSWVFGQEYPWNAIECRKKTDTSNNGGNSGNGNGDSQVELYVPDYMKDRLYDGTSVYPPSQLSTYGVNFVTQGQWLITVDNSVDDEIIVQHALNFFSASHDLDTSGDNPELKVYIDHTAKKLMLNQDDPASDTASEFITTNLGLGVIALAPVGSPKLPPVIGFIPSKFTRQPQPAAASVAPVNFTIYANTNTLFISDVTKYADNCDPGSGFQAGETHMTATLSENCPSLTFRILFKVIDATNDYTLFLKHWKVSAVGLTLTIVVNGDSDNALVKTVDSLEAEGGEANLTTITLRNQDFASVDYSDLLTPGLNSIDVTLTPNSGASAVYALRAVSIEAA